MDRSEGAPPGSPAWWSDWYARQARPRRHREHGLSLDVIVGAALTIIDAEGVSALTMRRLAEDLGTTHTSIYRHVASREELLVLAADRILGEIEPPAADLEPRLRAERLLRSYRRTLLAHPNVAPLFATGQLLGPNALAGREVGLALLHDAGASAQLAAEAFLTLTHYVIGSAVLDTAGAARTASEREAMAALFRTLSRSSFPTLAAHTDSLTETDSDAEFELGLGLLLDGVEARVRSGG
jgi:AcrR family transcriptional regulator